MFEHTRRTIALIGSAIAATLIVGVATAAGLVPQAGSSKGAGAPVETAAAAPTEATTPVAAEEAPPSTTATTAPPAAPTTAAPSRSRTTTAAAAAPSAASTAAPAPAAAASNPGARRNPSSAEVLAAMQAMKARIPVLPVSESYGRQFGNDVCSAFDAGKSYAQVVAEVVAKAKSIPFVTISSADAGFAVQTAVSLFCPGYQSKIG